MSTTADNALPSDTPPKVPARGLVAKFAALDPEVRRQWRLRLLFYVGVPVVLGFLLGWWRVGRAAGAPLDAALAYWIGMALVTTGLNSLVAWPIAAVARPRGAPLWLVLLTSQLLAGTLLLRPAAGAYAGWVGEMLDATLVHPAGASVLAMSVQTLPSNAVMWIGLNLLFLHGLGMPRFGYVPRGRAAGYAGGAGVAPRPLAAPSPDAPAVAAAVASDAAAAPPARAAPAFMERVRPERRGAVLALRAEGHYLRVYTTAGSDLVLYRLSDAAGELGADEGIQVHRSWWVAERALNGERFADRLRLTNGAEVPVSRSYRLAARTRGWLA